MIRLTKPYTPVACDLIDIIEIFATNSQKVTLIFTDNHMKIKRKVTFKSWFAETGEEFLLLEEGTKIRLDNIIAINGHREFGNSCAL